MNSHTPPIVGIIGSAGAYGRWLRAFLNDRMGLQVLGHDPADPSTSHEDALLEQCDVLLFSAPIRQTPAVIRHWVARSAGREAGRLWLDVTSVKVAPIEAMLGSRAEVVGLHPMTAPPKAPSLRGRVLAVCEARLSAWRPWVAQLLASLEADCVRVTPAHHDRAMALVQSMVHASHLAQAGVLRGQMPQLGGLEGLMPLRSASFEMDTAIAARILSLNPAIYEDIQFGNPHSAEVLQQLASQLGRMAALVADGGEEARLAFREEYLTAGRTAFGKSSLEVGNYTFERLGYLLADLADTHTLSIHLPDDRPGSLRALLHVFERHNVSIASLHSSRTQQGEVHFRLGFNSGTPQERLDAVVLALEMERIGRVLPG